MTAFLVQTTLLLALAYLAGAALACFVRRLLADDAPSLARPERRMEAAPRPDAATVTVYPAPRPAEAKADASREPLRRVEPLPEFADRPSSVSRFTRALTGAEPQVPRPAPAPAVPPPQSPPAASRTVAAATATTVAAAAAAATAAPVAPAPADDLERIKGIDAGIETALNKLGVRRYAEIARWIRRDVDTVSKALGFKGRIEQQNWIEQAAVLAQGGKTHYVRVLERGNMTLARPSADAGAPATLKPAAAPAAVAPPQPRPLLRLWPHAGPRSRPARRSPLLRCRSRRRLLQQQRRPLRRRDPHRRVP